MVADRLASFRPPVISATRGKALRMPFLWMASPRVGNPGRQLLAYQSEYVNALWHLDFHHGSIRVPLEGGRFAYPLMLGTLDDCSRLCCHAQWYLQERSEELCHGLSQAFQKRSLPRAMVTDNGSAMVAAETQEGLGRLGIVWENTLPFSPNQNVAA